LLGNTQNNSELANQSCYRKFSQTIRKPVPKGKVYDVALYLAGFKTFALDTETTGLYPWQGDKPFSLIIACEDDSFYFNLKNYGDTPAEQVLSKEDLLPLHVLFRDKQISWYMHNAKFDMAMLEQLGISIAGDIIDTEVQARLLNNTKFNYTLSALVKEIGLEKSKAADEYIKKHKLTSKVMLAGGKEDTLKHFDRIPLEVIMPYALRDVEITLKLGEYQRKEISYLDKMLSPDSPKIEQIRQLEIPFTKVLYGMEKRGFLVDLEYSQKGYEYELARATRAAERYSALTGREFVDSGKAFSVLFDELGLSYPKSAKGNPEFQADFLATVEHEVAPIILEHRDATKRYGTYFANFLRFADSSGRIHANIRQAGTDTGRLSYSEPNLQNLSKEEETSSPFPIRRAFLPSGPNRVLVMVDYDQMEYRLMLDYAKELSVIEKVLGGLDVHEATAQEVGVTRSRAKTINFLLLYGGGAQKLANALGVSLFEAKVLKARYFAKLPLVEKFIKQVQNRATTRGYIFDWLGRRYQFDNPKFSYKAPNALIQGGCATAMKRAMVNIQELLTRRKASTELLAQVHDELVFDADLGELDLFPEIMNIMSRAYPHKYLPLTVSASHSFKSWYDKVEGLPV
jgi:DNA polymerase I